MNGYDRIKNMVKDQKDEALKQTVNYLLSRTDLEQKFLNEDKNLDEMCKFIKNKGQQHCRNGWNYITNELVYAWAVMYFSLPNSFLKIKSTSTKSTPNKPANTPAKDNVIPIEKAKEKVKQLSLFGGAVNE